MAIVANEDLELERLDVKIAFLHGELDETIYMKLPQHFEVNASVEKVCLLTKSLYGLKQSPRHWYKKFDDFMIRQDFLRSNCDWYVYIKKLHKDKLIYLLLYVDDMLLIASSAVQEINKLKSQLKYEFEMKE